MLDATRSHDVPESHFGKAVKGLLVVDRYSAYKAMAQVNLSKRWSGLTLFVDDSRIPMDNNYGERLIRGPAVGRKNYYGSGSEWSSRMAMMLFSIFATLALWHSGRSARDTG